MIGSLLSLFLLMPASHAAEEACISPSVAVQILTPSIQKKAIENFVKSYGTMDESFEQNFLNMLSNLDDSISAGQSELALYNSKYTLLLAPPAFPPRGIECSSGTATVNCQGKITNVDLPTCWEE